MPLHMYFPINIVLLMRLMSTKVTPEDEVHFPFNPFFNKTLQL